MNIALLKPEIQAFIEANVETNVLKLALQKNPFPEVSFAEILNQIACKQKAKEKLPTFFETKNIIFPSKVSLEQTSSEITAQYKSDIVSGDSLIDLTGGFGVDCLHFSKKIKKVVHCEINNSLSEIVKHNFKELNTSNIDFFAENGQDVLKNLNQKFDWIYIDPSRRNDVKGKVFRLEDCEPNVADLMDFYFEFTDNILIKTAPLLDISAGIKALKNVIKIHIIAIENEVKELLWEIKKNTDLPIEIKTINFAKNKLEVTDFQIEDNLFANYSLAKKYLYEPNSALYKSGKFEAISSVFKIDKLHQNSHLYTSENLIDFPGRVFEIEKQINYSKEDIKLNLANKKSNISTRNFHETVAEIRSKWKIKDGGKTYAFFTTDINNQKIVLLCKKIENQ